MVGFKRLREFSVEDYLEEPPMKKIKYKKDQLDEPCFMPTTGQFSFMDKGVFGKSRDHKFRAEQVRAYNAFYSTQPERIDK